MFVGFEVSNKKSVKVETLTAEEGAVHLTKAVLVKGTGRCSLNVAVPGKSPITVGVLYPNGCDQIDLDLYLNANEEAEISLKSDKDCVIHMSGNEEMNPEFGQDANDYSESDECDESVDGALDVLKKSLVDDMAEEGEEAPELMEDSSEEYSGEDFSEEDVKGSNTTVKVMDEEDSSEEDEVPAKKAVTKGAKKDSKVDTNIPEEDSSDVEAPNSDDGIAADSSDEEDRNSPEAKQNRRAKINELIKDLNIESDDTQDSKSETAESSSYEEDEDETEKSATPADTQAQFSDDSLTESDESAGDKYQEDDSSSTEEEVEEETPKAKEAPKAAAKRPASTAAVESPAKKVKQPVVGADPESKFVEELTKFLKANGRTPLNILGTKVKKPKEVKDKFGKFVKSKPEVFKVSKGDMIELESK